MLYSNPTMMGIWPWVKALIYWPILIYFHLPFTEGLHTQTSHPNACPMLLVTFWVSLTSPSYIAMFPFFSWFCKFDFSSFKAQKFVAFSQVRFQLIIIFLIFPVRIQLFPTVSWFNPCFRWWNPHLSQSIFNWSSFSLSFIPGHFIYILSSPYFC